MIKYKDFRPTQFDPKGLGIDDRQEWFVVNVMQTRDSGCLEQSNFDCTLRELGGESDTVEVHRFGHWGPGWFEVILIDPNDSKLVKNAEEIENALASYPVLDESDYSEREMEEANRIWEDCYSIEDRIEYIREHRDQFSFYNFKDLMSCVRGKYFAGYSSELIGRH